MALVLMRQGVRELVGVWSFRRFQKCFSRPPLLGNALNFPLDKLGSPKSSLRCIIHATTAVVAAASGLYASACQQKIPEPLYEMENEKLVETPGLWGWHFVHFFHHSTRFKGVGKVSPKGIGQQALC